MLNVSSRRPPYSQFRCSKCGVSLPVLTFLSENGHRFPLTCVVGDSIRFTLLEPPPTMSLLSVLTFIYSMTLVIPMKKRGLKTEGMFPLRSFSPTALTRSIVAKRGQFCGEACLEYLSPPPYNFSNLVSTSLEVASCGCAYSADRTTAPATSSNNEGRTERRFPVRSSTLGCELIPRQRLVLLKKLVSPQRPYQRKRHRRLFSKGEHQRLNLKVGLRR